MLKKDIVSVIVATIYLLVYCELLQFKATEDVAMIMLLLSPVIISWMVYRVVKHGFYTGRELGKDEFGYADKQDEDLDVF